MSTATRDRRKDYKPISKVVSQEIRRVELLEEQKRRRALKVASSRNLDLFANLSLEEHSDEELNDGLEAGGDYDASYNAGLAAASVAPYVTLLQEKENNDMIDSSTSQDPLTIDSQYTQNVSDSSILPDPSEEPSPISSSETKKPRKRGGKNSHKRRSEANKSSNSNKYKAGNSQWADKCMYAELLEMNGDVIWDTNMGDEYQSANDGLPSDLEHAWVAIAPVPKGKRCLVVTQQSAGVAGVVPNTSLRSRLLGKSLLARFPSSLPPLTVLDCILDDQWRENGILHVLDVVRWKGQDVADCEAGFRFWWRDTRLAELTQSPPPSFHFVSAPATSTSKIQNTCQKPSNGQSGRYKFSYPTTFIPIPYHSTTTLSSLDASIIPASRSVREILVPLPTSIFSLRSNTSGDNNAVNTGGMEIELPTQISFPVPTVAPTMATAFVQPDGLLLYVAQASYEPGTSPLSNWIPIQGYDDNPNEEPASVIPGPGGKEGPLDLFQRLVRRRLLDQQERTGSTFVAGQASVNRISVAGQGDVEMEI